MYTGLMHIIMLMQKGLTSLMIAANAEEVDAVKLLVRYRCEVNTQNKVCTAYDRQRKYYISCIVHVFNIISLSKPGLIIILVCYNIIPAQDGLTALMMASKQGVAEIVETLIKAKADVKICENVSI